MSAIRQRTSAAHSDSQILRSGRKVSRIRGDYPEPDYASQFISPPSADAWDRRLL
jgi:hypothetical protein